MHLFIDIEICKSYANGVVSQKAGVLPEVECQIIVGINLDHGDPINYRSGDANGEGVPPPLSYEEDREHGQRGIEYLFYDEGPGHPVYRVEGRRTEALQEEQAG